MSSPKFPLYTTGQPQVEWRPVSKSNSGESWCVISGRLSNAVATLEMGEREVLSPSKAVC